MVTQMAPFRPIKFMNIAPHLIYLAGHIVMLSLALNWAGYLFAWKSATIIGLLSGGCAAGVVAEALRYLIRTPVGVLYGKEGWPISHYQHALSSLIEDWMFGTFVIALVYIPFWSQTIGGHSPFEKGVITLSFTGPFLLFQFLLARVLNPSLPSVFLLRIIFSAIAATMAALLTRPGSSTGMEIGLIVTLGFSLSALLRWPRSVVVPFSHSSPIMEWHYSPLLVSIAHCGRSPIRFQDSFYFADFGAPVFTNRFLVELRRIPGVDQTKAITIFKTDPATYKDLELLAFKKALATVFYVPLVLAGLTFFISLAGFTYLNSLRKKLDFGEIPEGIREASYPFDRNLLAVKHRGHEDHRDRVDSEFL